ncbi:26S proteasome regulatory subunit RPN11 [Dictyocoela muelleri]|nr:26S proteasome regulatory subunit RPN11 [Dictyocoela muelleri]
MFDFANSNNPPDTSETIHISSLALLKMLKHGRAGVPMEVMGLMLGEFVDEYTVNVVDVFAMPQSGTGVTVEAVDSVFQAKMMDLLSITGRGEYVVGWYHSHPGFGCWLSNIDVSTQQSFEKIDKRCVAVVIDPIQSVKGKVVIDAFRCIEMENTALGLEPRQTTSNIEFINKPSVVASIHGLNRYYYSLNISYPKNEIDMKLLLNLNRKTWANNLIIEKTDRSEELLETIKNYQEMVRKTSGMSKDELKMYKLGKVDYRKRLLALCDELCCDKSVYSLLLALHSMILSDGDK